MATLNWRHIADQNWGLVGNWQVLFLNFIRSFNLCVGKNNVLILTCVKKAKLLTRLFGKFFHLPAATVTKCNLVTILKRKEIFVTCILCMVTHVIFHTLNWEIEITQILKCSTYCLPFPHMFGNMTLVLNMVKSYIFKLNMRSIIFVFAPIVLKSCF